MTDLDDLKYRIKLSELSWIMPSLQLLCISDVVVSQETSRPAAVISSTALGAHCVFSDNYDLSYCCWSVEHLQLPVMTLRFAIHGHCSVRKVKQRRWLGKAVFCYVSSFRFVTIFFAKKLQLYIWICQSYVQSTVNPFLEKMAFFNDVTIISSLHSVMHVLMGRFTIFQSHKLSGWLMPKIMKSCRSYGHNTVGPLFRTRCTLQEI